MFVCPECGTARAEHGFCTNDGAGLADGSSDPLLGQVVGSYRIATRIGAGGMGQVYKAVHPSIGSRVAIKVLATDCASRPDLVERFFAEARAVNVIRHENIVNVLDLAALADGRPYIVMEYLDGAPLSAALRTHAAPPLGSVTRLFLEVLDALGAAHAHGIIHRDLKPDNIFVSPAGRAKVLDFGIAKLRPDISAVDGSTRAGALVGTPSYMSPEQASGRPVDTRTDVYSAGVVLYEACTGRLPFESRVLFELLQAHVQAPPPPPRALRADLPPPLEALILRALEKDPAQRFQTVGELAAALSQVSASLPADSFAPLLGARASAAPSALSGPPHPARTHDSGASRSSGGRRVLPYLALGTAGVIVLAGLGAVVVVVAIVAFALRSEPEHVIVPPETIVPPEMAGPGGAEDPAPSPDLGAAQQLARKAAQRSPGGPQPPPGFDPKRFDAWVFYPQAEQMARGRFPDAKLVRLSFRGINAQGIIDMTVSTGMLPSGAEYRFFSPEAGKPAPGAPSNAAPSGECLYYVNVSESGVSGRPTNFIGIKETIITKPTCTPKQVWLRAQQRGAPTGNLIGDLSYYGFMGRKARWWAKIGSFGTGGLGDWVDDDC